MTTRKPRTRNHRAKMLPADPGDTSGEWIFGKHAVQAALANRKRRHQRLLLTREAEAEIDPPPMLAPQIVTRQALNELLSTGAHQGVALRTMPLPQPALATACSPTPAGRDLVVVLDQVTDPHNVGAILRSAAAFGARAVITTDRHAPKPHGIVAKAAAGAVEQVPFVTVPNLVRALKRLQQLGYWRIGLCVDADQAIDAAQAWHHVALVLGSEGRGLRRLTAENCDAQLAIPHTTAMQSLNVSNAAAIALYALSAQRPR